jgi:hypothetical protein
MMMYDYDNGTSEKINRVEYNTVLLKIVFTYSDEDFIITSDSFNCPFMRFFLYELSVEQKEKLRKYIIRKQ